MTHLDVAYNLGFKLAEEDATRQAAAAVQAEQPPAEIPPGAEQVMPPMGEGFRRWYSTMPYEMVGGLAGPPGMLAGTALGSHDYYARNYPEKDVPLAGGWWSPTWRSWIGAPVGMIAGAVPGALAGLGLGALVRQPEAGALAGGYLGGLAGGLGGGFYGLGKGVEHAVQSAPQATVPQKPIIM